MAKWIVKRGEVEVIVRDGYDRRTITVSAELIGTEKGDPSSADTLSLFYGESEIEASLEDEIQIPLDQLRAFMEDE
jgi:hypothetical protein